MQGPSGVQIKLQENRKDGFLQTVLTDESGMATFEEVPASNFWVYFEQQTEKGSKPLYQVKTSKFQVFFNTKTGFKFDGETDGFVIQTTLVEGHIKQQLNDSEPAPFVKVIARTINESSENPNDDVIQTVFTDSNGRY